MTPTRSRIISDRLGVNYPYAKYADRRIRFRPGLISILLLLLVGIVCRPLAVRALGQRDSHNINANRLPPNPVEDNPRPTPHQENPGGGGFGLGFSFDLGRLFGGSRSQNPAKVLDKEGPQFAPSYNMSDFSIIAYVKGGWPMVIEYQLEVPSVVVLTIVSEGVEPFYYNLQTQILARHQEKLRIPDRFGDKARVAQYSIRALSAAPGEVKPVYLRIFGMGAGPRAVGSLKLDNLILDPTAINTSLKEKTHFSFHSHDDFTRGKAVFWQVARAPRPGPASKQRADEEPLKGPIDRDTGYGGYWDGKAKGKTIKGQYQVQICAWVDGDHGGDWGYAESGQLISVQ